ncbi:NYN domain-containing protein [Catellatospora tritici]|uniref:NYN domain-containing protein n=1 Tax=Catellatospora tritici TaxID=2851566 RepID=UPI001C2DA78C|nr:NYN domain-containing protein [Catellatospora tritici]MBV1849104.1 NYN domain-containing protein [Catellatospora tritici]
MNLPRRHTVLVDVGYLYAASGELVLGTSNRSEFKVDAEPLIHALMQLAATRLGDDLLRVYWFDAARDRVPTIDQRVIAQMGQVKLRLGNLNMRGQQKGVDAQIRSDLETLARHKAVTDAVLVAGDEDMLSAIEAAQSYGVRVHLWGVEPPYGTNQAERLLWESDTVFTLDADTVRPYFTPTGRIRTPTPAEVFSGRPAIALPVAQVSAVPEPRPAPVRPVAAPLPERTDIVDIGEFVAQKWILARGRDNIGDLLPGPKLPTVIDKELLVEAEKELGISLRQYEKARLWVRDGFWSRVYREFGMSRPHGEGEQR